ncbi:MAG: PilT/PilU family type 4a pilus ATPase [Candidatus Omnitrophica bacterium]|nr:PilT/PilU family type 4a pilus ATPase [Candidatus Omnitrophota bacterium]MBU1047739.1 PilT/PilU family type 4a pilus ATPase [Candidatus Omnitrophota bacterium]MBU1630894.1 PilT/PilU family type 4a pilus ATPase [Candidatus Omnitrophota bacterium]MBU1889361.1 PilT/PilU family type 4a pilus ATPase [Candidatus Omnitrophota bacterium]
MNEKKIDLDDFLGIMLKENASDLYFKVGSVPYIRTGKGVQPISVQNISSADMELISRRIMNDGHKEAFNKHKELDLAYSSPKWGRFRVNMFLQRGEIGIVLREVKRKISTFQELNLPSEVLKKLSLEPRGLVLITGPAGCGKSTTLASIIEFINQNKESHIVTIEDPIEFLHEDKKSLINQREIGTDTNSFAMALKHVIRQSPDVILIGETRDTPTAEAAIMAAETGHLVFSTLHTIDAPSTLERILNFFPPHIQPQMRVQLAYVLKGVISLRLLTTLKGERIPAVSVMIPTPTIQKLILENRLLEIREVMEQGELFGMQTFTQALLKLYKERQISHEYAMQMSDAPTEFALKTKGIFRGTKEEIL